jgi:hypothetical protein
MKVLSVTDVLALAESRSVKPLQDFPGKGFLPWACAVPFVLERDNFKLQQIENG